MSKSFCVFPQRSTHPAARPGSTDASSKTRISRPRGGDMLWVGARVSRRRVERSLCARGRRLSSLISLTRSSRRAARATAVLRNAPPRTGTGSGWGSQRRTLLSHKTNRPNPENERQQTLRTSRTTRPTRKPDGVGRRCACDDTQKKTQHGEAHQRCIGQLRTVTSTLAAPGKLIERKKGMGP